LRVVSAISALSSVIWFTLPQIGTVTRRDGPRSAKIKPHLAVGDVAPASVRFLILVRARRQNERILTGESPACLIEAIGCRPFAVER